MWKIYNQADGDNSSAEILLYDAIADWDSEAYGYISAKGLINKLKALEDVQNITLRINSEGGDIFQAFAIYNYLKSCKANITVKIDGIAASAASIIAMAGDKILMPENSMLMLHNPSGGCFGEADDMRALAEVLDKVKAMCVSVYGTRSMLNSEKISEIMENESYLTAAECKELNLCDEVIDKLDVAARMQKFMNFKASISNDDLAKIKNEAAIQERERLKALDDLRLPGREAIIDKAKYEEPRDIRDIALELVNYRHL